jgi:hypothetical protein
MIGIRDEAAPASPAPSRAPEFAAKVFSEAGWLQENLGLEHRPGQERMARGGGGVPRRHASSFRGRHGNRQVARLPCSWDRPCDRLRPAAYRLDPHDLAPGADRAQGPAALQGGCSNPPRSSPGTQASGRRCWSASPTTSAPRGSRTLSPSGRACSTMPDTRSSRGSPPGPTPRRPAFATTCSRPRTRRSGTRSTRTRRPARGATATANAASTSGRGRASAPPR